MALREGAQPARSPSLPEAILAARGPAVVLRLEHKTRNRIKQVYLIFFIRRKELQLRAASHPQQHHTKEHSLILLTSPPQAGGPAAPPNHPASKNAKEKPDYRSITRVQKNPAMAPHLPQSRQREHSGSQSALAVRREEPRNSDPTRAPKRANAPKPRSSSPNQHQTKSARSPTAKKKRAGAALPDIQKAASEPSSLPLQEQQELPVAPCSLRQGLRGLEGGPCPGLPTGRSCARAALWHVEVMGSLAQLSCLRPARSPDSYPKTFRLGIPGQFRQYAA